MPTNANTNLVISVMGVPLYSARGLTQTLAPIQQAVQLDRTVNGAMIDLSQSQFRKYASTISCNDQEPPSTDRVWPGLAVEVQCVAELAFPTPDGETETASESESSSENEFGRVAVQGSIRQSGAFTFYRPVLQMVVTGFSIQRDEYGDVVSWNMTLEET